MKQNVYSGQNSDDYVTWKNGEPFDPAPSLKIRNHSPDGFSWGYLGSGCAQLALGILLEEFGKEVAQEYYQDFKFEIIGSLPNDHMAEWTLTSQEVHVWLTRYLQKKLHINRLILGSHQPGTREWRDANHTCQEFALELHKIAASS